MQKANVSPLTELGKDFPTVVAYKHLAPNGAKTRSLMGISEFELRISDLKSLEAQSGIVKKTQTDFLREPKTETLAAIGPIPMPALLEIL